MQGCWSPAILATEQAFLAALKRNWTVQRDGDSLTITAEALELRFKINPTVDTSKIIGPVWKLNSMFIDKHELVLPYPKADASLKLKPDGRFKASTGCREISGNYIINGNDLHIFDTQVKGNCPPELNHQDSFIISIFENSRIEILTGYRGVGGLGLHSADGNSLSYLNN